MSTRKQVVRFKFGAAAPSRYSEKGPSNLQPHVQGQHIGVHRRRRTQSAEHDQWAQTNQSEQVKGKDDQKQVDGGHGEFLLSGVQCYQNKHTELRGYVRELSEMHHGSCGDQKGTQVQSYPAALVGGKTGQNELTGMLHCQSSDVPTMLHHQMDASVVQHCSVEKSGMQQYQRDTSGVQQYQRETTGVQQYQRETSGVQQYQLSLIHI